MTDDMRDRYWMAKILCATGEYARVESLMAGKRHLLASNLPCRYMATLCAIKLKDWSRAEELLREAPFTPGQDVDGIKLVASMWHLDGLVASKQAEPARAKESMKKAVMEDPRCVEAFTWLLDNHVLSKAEELALVQSVDFSMCGDDQEVIRALYLTSLKTYDEPKIVELETKYKLKGNYDLLLRRAEALFDQCRYAKCYSITSAMCKEDPHYGALVPIHVSCIQELGFQTELFAYSHRLVDDFPDRASTWYAVGAYYMTIKNNLEARKYFGKSTEIDSNFAPGWLGYAHSFAAESDVDQAISAYATAAKLFNGYHVPLMHLGTHYILSRNLGLAEDYLLLAEGLNDSDPTLLHELGSLYLTLENFGKAIEYFERALRLADDHDFATVQWETTWFMLAQAHRKNGDIAKAICYAQRVLALNRNAAQAHTLLGYIAHEERKFGVALEHYQTSLSYDPNDTVTHDLFQLALKDQSKVDLDPHLPEGVAEDVLLKDYFLPPDLESYREFDDHLMLTGQGGEDGEHTMSPSFDTDPQDGNAYGLGGDRVGGANDGGNDPDGQSSSQPHTQLPLFKIPFPPLRPSRTHQTSTTTSSSEETTPNMMMTDTPGPPPSFSRRPGNVNIMTPSSSNAPTPSTDASSLASPSWPQRLNPTGRPPAFALFPNANLPRVQHPTESSTPDSAARGGAQWGTTPDGYGGGVGVGVGFETTPVGRRMTSTSHVPNTPSDGNISMEMDMDVDGDDEDDGDVL
ncbi:anaphase promoting complex subunit cdc16 [Thoreauomyces humboldtii]|nr:anaphase promoting complex subunit cdc16 [Thoreauomyces humboldtii]